MTTVTDDQKDRKPFSLGSYSVGKSSRLQRPGTIYFCSAIPPPGDLAISHGLRQLLTTSVPWKAGGGRKEWAGLWQRQPCPLRICFYPTGQNWTVGPKEAGKQRLDSGTSCPHLDPPAVKEGKNGGRWQLCLWVPKAVEGQCLEAQFLLLV